jgi:hypothetical protein
MVSPCVHTEARLNATMVNTRPVPPSTSAAYSRGNFKINTDRSACAAENTTTATMNPDTDNETPGTTHAATSSPIAHDPRSTTARSRICLMAKGRSLTSGCVLNTDDGVINRVCCTDR